jgi:plasmid rolling circle replication initiator protein Rep
MQNYNKNSDKKNTSLDTLGQLPTFLNKNLLKRARSKWYTERITAGLLYENSPLHKYYQRAYYCNHVLEQKGQEIKAHYCDTRICHICNRIRTAKMMNGYMDQLHNRELQFVTLTLPNVNAANLRYTCSLLTQEMAKIIRVFGEKKKVKINGIRKLEVTYNNIEDTFHPHLHLVVDKAGDELVNAWLKRIP